MDAEHETLDPHEVKVLADILALVLEDQPPAAAVALETVRRKARQHRITGGALKNLFQAIAASPMAESGRRGSVPALPEEAVERLRAANRNLERALAAANGEVARLQYDVEQVQGRLTEAHHVNRSLAERWRSGQRQANFLVAGIVACILVITGLLADRLLSRPAPQFERQAEALPASRADRPAPASPPATASPRQATPAGAPAAAQAGDPDLEDALRRLSRDDQGPAPGAGSAPAALASPRGNPVGSLPPEAYRGVIDHVRTCWRGYVGKLADARFQARLQVVTDESGVVREAKLAPDEATRLSDPGFKTFVEAAMRSVLEPDCAQLPIPAANLGHKIAFDFLFVP
ncbi:MAG: hypothetical protein JO047_02790 [Alphaproteobacteria bacterium]|nr:hypothetical protein [Alphaproteobacteria bacterium]